LVLLNHTMEPFAAQHMAFVFEHRAERIAGQA
jgi:hypothetical protein